MSLLAVADSSPRSLYAARLHLWCRRKKKYEKVLKCHALSQKLRFIQGRKLFMKLTFGARQCPPAAAAQSAVSFARARWRCSMRNVLPGQPAPGLCSSRLELRAPCLRLGEGKKPPTTRRRSALSCSVDKQNDSSSWFIFKVIRSSSWDIYSLLERRFMLPSNACVPQIGRVCQTRARFPWLFDL